MPSGTGRGRGTQRERNGSRTRPRSPRLGGQVQEGVEMAVEQDHRPVAMVRVRTAASGVRVALANAYEQKLGDTSIPDPGFAMDLLAAIQAHRELWCSTPARRSQHGFRSSRSPTDLVRIAVKIDTETRQARRVIPFADLLIGARISCEWPTRLRSRIRMRSGSTMVTACWLVRCPACRLLTPRGSECRF